MSRYRQVHCCIWNDDKFPFLSDQAQLVFFHLLTTPYGTPFGLFKASIGALADEKRWERKAYAKAFREAFEKGMVDHDERNLLVFIPHFVKYNPPTSPNVIKSWSKLFNELPHSELKHEWYQQVNFTMKAFGEAFQKAFREAFAKAMPNQEQEQEQEQEQKRGCPQLFQVAGPAPANGSFFLSIPLRKNGATHQITQSDLAEYIEMFPAVDVESELKKLKAWNEANPGRRKTARGIKSHIVSWLGNVRPPRRKEVSEEEWLGQFKEGS